MREFFRLAVETLERSEGVRDFALIGKLALIPQVPSVTSTLDIDFLAVIEDREAFAEELKLAGFQVGRIELPDKRVLIRFWRKEMRIPVDVFEASDEWQKRIVRDALRIRFVGKEIPIARKEGVLALKIAFYRDFKDREIVRMLLENPQLDRAYFVDLLRQAGLGGRLEVIAKRVGVQGWSMKNEKPNSESLRSFTPGL